MKTDDLTFKKTEAVEFHPLSYPISCPHCGTLFPPIENNGRLQGSPLQAKEAQANYMRCQPFTREQYLNLDKEELVTLLLNCQALIDEKITDVQTYTSTNIQAKEENYPAEFVLWLSNPSFNRYFDQPQMTDTKPNYTELTWYCYADDKDYTLPELYKYYLDNVKDIKATLK